MSIPTKIGSQQRDDNPELLFVGGESALVLATIPAKHWPFTVNYAETDANSPMYWERNISEYITNNHISVGCIIWDPLNDHMISKNHRLGHVYNSKLKHFKIASTIG